MVGDSGAEGCKGERGSYWASWPLTNMAEALRRGSIAKNFMLITGLYVALS